MQLLFEGVAELFIPTIVFLTHIMLFVCGRGDYCGGQLAVHLTHVIGYKLSLKFRRMQVTTGVSQQVPWFLESERKSIRPIRITLLPSLLRIFLR
jgi:hypothetical protein